MAKSKTLIIYHGDCFDGFTCAWLYWLYGDRENLEFYPVMYGTPPPDVNGKNVIIADFSYKRETLLKMIEEADSLHVYDHHKTAQADLEGLDFCTFDMERSGCGIVWDEIDRFKPEKPWLVDIVQDRDLWKFKRPDTKDAMGLISATPMSFEEWQKLSEMALSDVVAQGKAILKYIDKYGEKAIESSHLIKLDGHLVPTINISYQNCSEHLDKMREKFNSYPFVASFFLNKNRMWQFSLRSKGDFDVSEVAKKFGGGGHKNAAGFELNSLSEVGLD